MRMIKHGMWMMLISFLALASASWGESGVTDTEIVIGSCSALAGPASFLGTQTVLGAKAYINMVNEQGGVHGRQIKLVAYDDSYEPNMTIACVNRLIQQNNVFAMGFFVGTPTGAMAVRMAETQKVPILGLFTGAEILRNPLRRHVMHVRASYYDETRAHVDNLVKGMGMKKIAVFYQEDAFGLAVLEGVKVALKKYDMTPVALGTFPRNTLEIAKGMEQIKPTNPDAVIMVGPYAPVAEFVKRARTDKWTSLLLTVSFVGTEAFAKAAGKDGNGVLITQVMPPPGRQDLPAVALYHEALTRYFPEANANFVSLEGFVNAMVLVEGVKRAGKDLSRDKFIEAIEGIKDLNIGIGMDVNYSPTRHHAFEQVYYTVLRDGEAVVFTDWKMARQ